MYLDWIKLQYLAKEKYQWVLRLCPIPQRDHKQLQVLQMFSFPFGSLYPFFLTNLLWLDGAVHGLSTFILSKILSFSDGKSCFSAFVIDDPIYTTKWLFFSHFFDFIENNVFFFFRQEQLDGHLHFLVKIIESLRGRYSKSVRGQGLEDQINSS